MTLEMLEDLVLKSDNGNYLLLTKTNGGAEYKLISPDGFLLHSGHTDIEFDFFIECIEKVGYRRLQK